MDTRDPAPGDAPRASPFMVMAKPVASACNLSCSYCYYRQRSDMAPARRMDRAVLETFIRGTLEAQAAAPQITFGWQGGEPTLAGIDFFREALALQERWRPPGMRIVNTLQTNATLLDEGWAAFLREHGFLVGVSLDGPARLHDPLRGRASQARVLRALERLQRRGVEFNTLTVVHRLNWRHGREVYRFLRRIGVRHMQFIPLVERLAPGGALAGPRAHDAPLPLAPWSAPPEGYGQFLCDVFDDWLARDVGTIFVQAFEEHAAVLAGMPSQLCVFSPDCRSTPMLEANGDLYSCDHYAYPDWRLGNILETPLGELARSARQAAFGGAKTGALPADCRACAFLAACCGGCPKHRFVDAAARAPANNYLCASYRRFFAHSTPALARIARGALAARPG